MTIKKLWTADTRVSTTLFLVLTFLGLVVCLPTFEIKPYDPDRLVWDYQWLNVWSLGIAAFIGYLLFKTRSAPRAWLLVATISLFGAVATALLFDGAQFGYDGYWKDQKFYISYVLKLAEFSLPGDFYLRGLPPFYPPLYFYILSLWSRLAGVDAHMMIKCGYLIVMIGGPAVLYFLWSRLVPRLTAALITVATFLLSSLLLYRNPHEFVATTLFIPWWIHYVERASIRNLSWRTLVPGGAIGALIFMTYYYAFFVGAVLIVGRVIGLLILRRSVWDRIRRLACGILVLLAAAVFSSPFWLPLLRSMYLAGYTYHQEPWFALAYARLDLFPLELSLTSLVSLAGLLIILRRFRNTVYRGILFLGAAALGLYGLGYISGNLNAPILYQKVGEFVLWLSGACIGISLAYVVMLGRGRRQIASTVLVGLILLFMCSGFAALLEDKQLQAARTSQVMDLESETSPPTVFRDKVVLTGDEMFSCFAPAYLFIPVNQHYSHWAGKWPQRYAMLGLLEGIASPDIAHLVLTHNIYDSVDFVYLPRDASGHRLLLSLNNYPQASTTHTFSFSRALFDDARYFRPVLAQKIWRVEPVASYQTFEWPAWREASDSLKFLFRVNCLAGMLTSQGQATLRQMVPADWSQWRPVRPGNSSLWFSDTVQLIDCQVVPQGDSVCLLMAVKVRRPLKADYRIYLHVVAGDDPDRSTSYDFSPTSQTTTWKNGDIVICTKTFPSSSTGFRYEVGFFDGERRLEGNHKGRFQPK